MLNLLATLLHLPLGILLLVIGVFLLVISVARRLGNISIDLTPSGRIVAGRIGVSLTGIGVVLSIVFALISAGVIGGHAAAGSPTATTTTTARGTTSPTATQTATVPPQGWYYAPIPGPGCDQNGGQWTRSLDPFYYTCLSDSLRMTMKNSGFGNVLTRFTPPAGKVFPDDATATIDVFGFDSYACVDFGFEQSSQPDYDLAVCQDGAWHISKTQVAATVASGSIAAQEGHFVLLETKTGNLRIFFINGIQVGSFQDAPNIPTEDIFIELGASTSASARFKDFRITSQS
jgi:hypothetical protein